MTTLRKKIIPLNVITSFISAIEQQEHTHNKTAHTKIGAGK